MNGDFMTESKAAHHAVDVTPLPTERTNGSSSGYVVESHEQLEALSSPARRELIDAVQLLGPCAIAEVAEALGKPADSLYYHVRKLLQVGLLKQVALRRGVRRDEAVYDLPGRPLRLRFNLDHDDTSDLIVSSAAATLRLTERSFRAAVERRQGQYGGPKRDLLCERYRRPLNASELQEVNNHLDAIVEVLSRPVDSSAAAKGDVYSVTLAVTPVEVKPVNRRGD